MLDPFGGEGLVTGAVLAYSEILCEQKLNYLPIIKAG
jgi:hypothetical protein